MMMVLYVQKLGSRLNRLNFIYRFDVTNFMKILDILKRVSSYLDSEFTFWRHWRTN